jgi:hypothetical protein
MNPHPMKYFLIKYRFQEGSQEEWHREITQFISELDNDPELKGKISYRCLKGGKDGEYFHFAGAVDDRAVKLMQQREFFKRYSEKMRAVAGGAVDVSHLEIIAETQAGVS